MKNKLIIIVPLCVLRYSGQKCMGGVESISAYEGAY